MVRKRVLSAGLLASLLLVALSGCWGASTEERATAMISERVAVIKDGFSEVVQRTSLGSDLNFEDLPVQDLRSLTDEETRHIGRPVSGFYAFASNSDGFSITIVVVRVANAGGFSNANWTYYSCMRLEGVSGSADIDVVDQECPTSILEQFSISGEALPASRLDL